MGSRLRLPDLSLPPVNEDAEASMPPPGFVEHKVELKRSCPSPKDRSNKENVSSIKEDGLDISAFSKEETVKKRSKKAGRCNLRKSLAWNQAFFTEEGVLDPLEMSILSGSSTKSKESVLSVVNGQMSPLLRFHKSGDTPSLNTVEQKIFQKLHARSGRKNLKDENLLCKLNASIQEQQQDIMVSEAISSSKQITKSVPRQAVASSQKRIANTNVANPTSKIPKFMPTKSHAASLPASSRDAIPTPRNFKFDKSAAADVTIAVNTEQNLDVRCFPSNMKKQSACAQSSKSSAVDLCRPLVPLMEKGVSGFNLTSDSSATKAVQGTTISCSSVKRSSLFPKKAYHDMGGSVAPAHAKPSALRMPSPSLGFFQQCKLPPSCGTQPQRNVQPSRPTIPLIKSTSIKQAEESRVLPASTGQKSMKGPSAPKSFAGTIISRKRENSLVGNSLPSSDGDVVHPSIKENVSKMQLDMMNIRPSERSDSKISGQQALKRHHLLVDDNICTQLQVLTSENPEPNVDKEVPYVSNLMLEMDNKPLAHESRLAKETLKANISEDVHHACPLPRKKSASEIESPEHSSQQCSLGKLNDAELDEGASEADNQVKQPLSEYTGQVTHAVSGQGGQAAENLHLLSDLEYGFSATFDCSSLPKTKSNLTSSKEKVRGSGLISSLELSCSLAQETGIENNLGINRLTSISVEETKSSLRSNEEQMASSGFLGSSEVDCSSSQKRGIPVEKANSGTNDLAVRLTSSSEDSQPTSTDSKTHDFTVQIGDKDLINSEEEGTLVLEGSNNKQKDSVKQDIAHLKHHLNAVPFTDEWLAAIEAFGEEILERKTGPVQNSPPDKLLPEPGPWSPVKRKAQDIGPFDCTKYSTNLSAPDTS